MLYSIEYALKYHFVIHLIMLIVNSRFLTQKITGVQRFAIEISLRLKKWLPNEVSFVAPKNIIQHEVAKELDVQIVGRHTDQMWEQFDLPQWLKKNGKPLLLNLCNAAPMMYDNKLITLHDIIYLRYPKSFSLLYRMFYIAMVKWNVSHCKHIFTVSEFSKKELATEYKIQNDKISVVYSAVVSKFRHIDDVALKSQKYFLATSTSATPNKNFEAVVLSFLRFYAKNNDIKLYVYGDCTTSKVTGTTLDISLYKKHPGFKFLGRVDDETLIKLYSNAIAFVYPSRYEGFGLPPLEAQACGCPAISSTSSSLPEVLEDSAILCDPENHEEIAAAFEKIASDDEYRNNLIIKGYNNFKRFSWDAVANKIVSLIEMKNFIQTK